MPALVRAAQECDCTIGFDLAHGTGNLLLELHENGADFAAW
jgi:kynureninase